MDRLSDKLEAAMKAGTRNIKWALVTAALWLPTCAFLYSAGHKVVSFAAFLVIMMQCLGAWLNAMNNAQRSTIIAVLRERGE